MPRLFIKDAILTPNFHYVFLRNENIGLVAKRDVKLNASKLATWKNSLKDKMITI